MQIGFKLRETQETIEHKILSALAPEVNKLILRMIPGIQKRMRASLISRISGCAEVQAMISGSFHSELGMYDIRQRINRIIEIWADSIVVKPNRVRQVNRQLVGGISITAINSDYSDVLSLPEASFLTPEHSFLLPWLQWILVEGRSIVIRNYDIAVNRKNSRTGLYVMRKQSGNYKIPSEISGTSSNNFVTRSLANFDDVVYLIVEGEIDKT